MGKREEPLDLFGEVKSLLLTDMDEKMSKLKAFKSGHKSRRVESLKNKTFQFSSKSCAPAELGSEHTKAPKNRDKQGAPPPPVCESVTSPILMETKNLDFTHKLLDVIIPPYLSAWRGDFKEKAPQLYKPFDSLHVFIDHSNFKVGARQWLDLFKTQRSTTGRRWINYKSFLELLIAGHPGARSLVQPEEGLMSKHGTPSKMHLFDPANRPQLAKGFLVGSYPLDNHELPRIAQRLGFEVRMLQKVQKPVPATASALAIAELNTATADNVYENDPHFAPMPLLSSSTFPSYARAAMANVPVFVTVEQGVDEILALKICDSVLDYANRPGLLVLVSGDGAPSEFNPNGFLKYIQHALMLGWAVELWTWKHSISSKYKQLFSDDVNFRIYLLDDVAESIFVTSEDTARGKKSRPE